MEVFLGRAVALARSGCRLLGLAIDFICSVNTHRIGIICMDLGVWSQTGTLGSVCSDAFWRDGCFFRQRDR